MDPTDFFEDLKRSTIGQEVSVARLFMNSLLIHVGCQVGNKHGLVYRLKPTWHCFSPEAILLGSMQAQGASDRDLRLLEQKMRPLVGRKIEQITMDAISRDLTIHVEGGFGFRTFLADPRDTLLWQICVNSTRRWLETFAEGLRVCGPLPTLAELRAARASDAERQEPLPQTEPENENEEDDDNGPSGSYGDRLRAWDKAHVWHPFTPLADWNAADPLIIERADGVDLIDSDGKRYLDGVSSLWCNVHGHRHPALDTAIRDQLDLVAHTTLLGLTHPTAIELARALVKRAPRGLTRVFFSDDGATAVEVALKMAFQYWRQKPDPEPKRTRFVALGGAYHGDTIGDVSVGGVERFHAMFAPLLFPALRAPIPHCYRCPLGLERSSCEIACLAELERILAGHPGEIAAVVIEPLVQAAAGMIVHPEGYLRGLRELTRRHNTLLIADEVAVGFGRTGTLFACDQEGVSPDFLCLAKGLTGGYLPLAATLTTEEVYSAFYGTAADGKTFYHGHTYGGNPLGAAVALANLQVFDAERTLEHLRPKVEHLTSRLEEFRPLAHVGDIRQCGFLAAIELVADKTSKTPYPWSKQVGARVCRRARDDGLLIRPLADVLVIMPPLTITIEQLDTMIDTMLRAVREVTESPA